MLNKTPEIRLGGNYAALKANPWFDHLDWVWRWILNIQDKLMDRELKPPYVPPKEKIP
jgi:cGMP-dependent protein kinase